MLDERSQPCRPIPFTCVSAGKGKTIIYSGRQQKVTAWAGGSDSHKQAGSLEVTETASILVVVAVTPVRPGRKTCQSKLTQLYT